MQWINLRFAPTPKTKYPDLRKPHSKGVFLTRKATVERLISNWAPGKLGSEVKMTDGWHL